MLRELRDGEKEDDCVVAREKKRMVVFCDQDGTRGENCTILFPNTVHLSTDSNLPLAFQR